MPQQHKKTQNDTYSTALLLLLLLLLLLFMLYEAKQSRIEMFVSSEPGPSIKETLTIVVHRIVIILLQNANGDDGGGPDLRTLIK